MGRWSTSPVLFDPLWFIYQADVIIEGHFLLLLAVFVLLWRHRRPQEARLLLLAMLCYGASYVPPYFVSWVQTGSWTPSPGMKAAVFSIRPYLEGLSSLLATALQALVWWCLVRAAFGDYTPAETADEEPSRPSP